MIYRYLTSLSEIEFNKVGIFKNNSTTFSFVSAMTILNAIIIAVGRKNKNNAIKELEKGNVIYKKIMYTAIDFLGYS